MCDLESLEEWVRSDESCAGLSEAVVTAPAPAPALMLPLSLLPAALNRMLVDQIAELAELVDGLRNGKATHQQVVDKWVHTYRAITQAFGVRDECGCNANALFVEFGILAQITQIGVYEGAAWCLPVEGTVSLDPDYQMHILYQSLQRIVATLFPAGGVGAGHEVSAAAFDFYEPAAAAEEMAANDNNWWATAMTMPGATVPEPASVTTNVETAAAEDAQSSSSNTYIGLDGREHVIQSGVQLRKPVEVSDETIADLIRQIHELAKLVDVVNSNIRELRREAIDAGELVERWKVCQAPSAQFTEKWSTVYQNVLDAFAATDETHARSKTFFDKVGLVVACDIPIYQNFDNKHIVPLCAYGCGFDARWEAPLWIEEEDTGTNMQDAVLNFRIPLRKIIDEIFPLGTILKQDYDDDLGAVATDDDGTANRLHDHLQPFPSLTGKSQYVEADASEVERIQSVIRQIDEAIDQLKAAVDDAENDLQKDVLLEEFYCKRDVICANGRVLELSSTA